MPTVGNGEVFLEEQNYLIVSHGHGTSGEIREVHKKKANVLITAQLIPGLCFINDLEIHRMS